MNEIRNELLNIYNYAKADDKDKDLRLDMLLERFEIDIKRQLEDLHNKEQELKSNLETLEYVRNELRKEEK